MSAFELIELSFDPEDAEPTLEDEFTMAIVEKDLEKLEDPEHLQIASKPVSYTHLTLPTINWV